MVNPSDLAEYMVEYGLARNFDIVIARYQNVIAYNISIVNGEVASTSINRTNGLGAKLIYKGVNIHTSTNIFSFESVKNRVEYALAKAKAYSKDKFRYVTLYEVESTDISHVVKEDKPFIDYKDELISDLMSLDDEIKEYAKIDVLTRIFNIHAFIEEKYITTSEGVKVYSKIPRILLHYRLVSKAGDKYISRDGFLGGSGGVESIEYESLKSDVKSILDTMYNIAFKAVNIEDGEYNIVIGNELSGLIAHNAVGHAFEADRVLGMEGGQLGESYVSKNDLNNVIASEGVNVYDDPTLPSLFGYYLYDDDGIQTRRRTLIKDGIISEFLHNRYTASIYGIPSNASARAESYMDEPIVRMGVTYFEPGDRGFKELIEEARYGIYIKNVSEWSIDDKGVNQRYVGFEAYLIDGGEIKNPLKYPVIETTSNIILKSVKALGDDLRLYPLICIKGEPIQRIPVNIGGPHMLITKIRVLRR